MTEPRLTVPYVCGHCDGEKTAVNPKWLTWRRERAGLSIDQMSKKIRFIKTKKGGSAASYQYVYKLEAGFMRCTDEVYKVYNELLKAAEPFKTRRVNKEKVAEAKATKATKKQATKKAAKKKVAKKVAKKNVTKPVTAKKASKPPKARANWGNQTHPGPKPVSAKGLSKAIKDQAEVPVAVAADEVA